MLFCPYSGAKRYIASQRLKYWAEGDRDILLIRGAYEYFMSDEVV